MSKQDAEQNSSELSLRKKTFELLDIRSTTLTGKIIDWFLMTLIAANVIAVIMETEPWLYQQYQTYLYWLEIFSVLVFTIEYILRLWSCPDNPAYKNTILKIARLKYSVTPMAIIDLIAIIPFYLAFLTNIDLRFLRVLRLLRIFKLTRYSEAMTTLLKVLKEEINSFAAAIFIMIVIMIIAASGIFLVEHDDQPEVFGSIPQSMWWSIVTLTTVGYGDIYPISTLGKMFAAVIMIAGVGLVALPTGILASGFSDNLHRNREKLSKELRDALEDGVIDEDEAKYLEEVRKNLGLSEEKYTELKETIIQRRENAQKHSSSKPCPYCGK